MIHLLKISNIFLNINQNEFTNKKRIQMFLFFISLLLIFYCFYSPNVYAAVLLKERNEEFFIDHDTKYKILYKTVDFRNISTSSIKLTGVGKILGSKIQVKRKSIFELTKNIDLNFSSKLQLLEIKTLPISIRTLKTKKLFFLRGGAFGILCLSLINSFYAINNNELLLDEKKINESEKSFSKRTIIKNKLQKFIPYLLKVKAILPYLIIIAIGGRIVYFNRERIACFIDILALKLAHYLDLDFEPIEENLPEALNKIFKPSNSIYFEDGIFDIT